MFQQPEQKLSTHLNSWFNSLKECNVNVMHRIELNYMFTSYSLLSSETTQEIIRKNTSKEKSTQQKAGRVGSMPS